MSILVCVMLSKMEMAEENREIKVMMMIELTVILWVFFWSNGIYSKGRGKRNYDVIGSLLEKGYSDSSPSCVFAYGENGNMVSMSSEAGESEFVYDELGRLKEAKDGRGQRISYAYDDYGRICEIGYPKERKVLYKSEQVCLCS